jgi:hypothetical protein
MKTMKTIIKTIFLSSIFVSLNTQAQETNASTNSNIKVSAKIEAGCSILAHDVHFDFSKNQTSARTEWHTDNIKVFTVDQFLELKVKCSKSVNFKLGSNNSEYSYDTKVFNLKHTTNPNAPSLRYWLNNWGKSGTVYVSPNITKHWNTYTRLHNANRLSYTMLDSNEGFIKFAVQVEGDSIYKYEAGNYSDTLNILITY